MFIVFEGLDGAGTTTQTRLLTQWLTQRGVLVHPTAEPSTGTIGQLIRQFLKQTDNAALDPHALALLFAADRMDHVHREIVQMQSKGYVVISDRYVYSSLAYQSIELSEPDGIDWVFQINRHAPTPDVVIYLRLANLAEGQRRITARGGEKERFDDADRQAQVHATYERVLASRNEVIVIDATQSIETIQHEIQNRISIMMKL